MLKEKINRYIEKYQATVYSEPEDTFHFGQIPEMVKNYFVTMQLPLTAYVLDIGCGQGRFMDLVRDLGYTNLVGVTLSNEDMSACGIKGHSVIKTDMSDIPVPEEMVDLIWCRHALEHSPFPLFTLYEFHRLLKAGGKVYVEVPAPDCERNQEYNPNHYSVLGDKMWASLFLKAGFAIDSAYIMEYQLQGDNHVIHERNFIFVIQKK